MAQEILAKTILNTLPQPDRWFGLKYNLNLYRGCQHQCIYCDSRSACYQIENFAAIQVKTNAVELLDEALAHKRIIGTVGTGSMNDPYMPIERQYNLTGRALQVLARRGFPVHIITKSDLVVRDVETLRQISQVYAAVSFSITSADDGLGKKVEPGAPLVSARLKAMQTLAQNGILTGVTMMPILPFLEDSVENILAIVRLAKEHGASYILPAFGVTMRSGSREFFYAKLDQHFPGVKERYIQRYGERYECSAPNHTALADAFYTACQEAGIATKMPVFAPRSKEPEQLKLF